ncbi:replication-relaxation family protein [Streptomyces sp. S07_1.15]|uniref:replication-relaxation family protein n=1 Tax=Streptomyces sp. S07_1.15 TaxID=2873925 RepID=UPI001D137E2E|nr:replication-relaxation family protein [Streptomyces sp. S07_1.15]MCC3655855.1 replication-relaxation family protein [Streptomyces sp. S07_1.15]
MTTAPCHTAPPAQESAAHRVLAVLAQHRMATSAQLKEMLGMNRSALSRLLSRLHRQDLIAFITLPRAARARAWFLQPDGVRATRDWPELRGRPPYPVTSATAASLRTAHTLTAVRTHLAFARDARERGDEHGPLDWTPEVSHQLPDAERLISDALLHYTLHEAGDRRVQLRAFVEVDRATMTAERLASKLIEYARFHTYTPVPVGRRSMQQAPATGPAWQRWYPVFPRVLFVLTGAGPTALANRTASLRAMAAEHPLVASMARRVPLGAAVLEDLEAHGPRAAVWQPLDGRTAPCSWTDL